MDLIALGKDAWRQKWVTVPIAALTFLLALWVLAIKPSTYTADASYALISPPACPTPSQIAADPALAKVNCNNPYVSYGDMTVVVDLLSQAMADPAVKQELADKGVTGSFAIAPSDTLTAPILDIAASGGSPAAASHAATTVADLTIRTLKTLQVQQHVVSQYMITAQQLNAPDQPTAKVSSKIRDVIAIIAIGLIAWFIALSVAKGLEEQRRKVSVFLRPRPNGTNGHAPTELSPSEKRAKALASQRMGPRAGPRGPSR